MTVAITIPWEQVLAEASALLQALLRIDTTNPPGNEIAAVRFLAALLDQEGIDYQIFEAAPSRGSLVATLPGTDSSEGPLLLSSHLDVVPAEAVHWTHPPFAGILADGFIWGRGAVDMKQMTVMEIMALLMLKRQGLKPRRRLILAAVADEEAGCRYGSQWLVDNHPSLIRAEYALNELGAFTMHLAGQQFYPIGVAEKGVCWFEVKAKGNPGHGAMPNASNAVVKLGLAAQKLHQKSLPYHCPAVVADFISALAAFHNPPARWVLQGLLHPWSAEPLLRYFFSDKKKAATFRFLLHNVTTPTGCQAGEVFNVIPAEASLKVDGRLLPGQSVEDFLCEVKNLLGPDYEILVHRAEEANTVPYDHPFYQVLCRSLMKHEPRAIPVPFLIPGYTDAKHYARLGIKTYGFCPTRLAPGESFAELYHGHNERLSLDSLLFGIKVIYDVLLAACF